MAILQQPGTGYRDPSKAMSIKALQSRMKAAQEAAAQATQIQNPIVSPAAGIAHLAGVAAAGLGQSQAENAEAAGRQRLAELKAGINMETGPTAQQLAEIGTLDEEFANQAYRDMMQARVAEKAREDTQTFQAGESQLERDARIAEETRRQGYETTSREDTQTFETGRDVAKDEMADQNAKDAAAVAAAQAEQNAALGTDEGKINAAIKAGTMTPEEGAAQLQTIRDKAAADLASTERTSADPYTGTGDIEADYNAGKYGAPGSPEAIKLRDQAHAAENLKGTPTPAPGSDYLKTGQQEAAKRHDEIIKEGNAAPAFISDIRRISDLGKQIGTGKWAEIKNAIGPYAEMLGVDVTNLGEMQAYEAIVNKMAPQMRPANSGSSSDYDAKQFLRSLSSLGNDPKGNQIIEATFQALEQHKINAAALASRALKSPNDPDYLPWNEVDAQIAALPYPYDMYNKFVGSPSVGGGGGDAGGGDGGWTVKEVP